MTGFADRLIGAVERTAPCVVGLDPVLDYIPDSFLRECGLSREGDLEEQARALEAFGLMVIEAVHDLVPAIKPQAAYFERYGSFGMRALERCMEAAREAGLEVILDVKRGDIGSTSTAYARAYLDRQPPRPWEADCVTLTPYLGEDSLAPFVDVAKENEKGLFVCVRTSNPGASIVQMPRGEDGRHLFEVTADLVKRFNDEVGLGERGYGPIGAVVGATQADAAKSLRDRLPGVLFLVPGWGAQGGKLATVLACFDDNGSGAIVNSARAVLYPSRFGGGEGEGKDAIRAAAQKFVDEVGVAVRTK